MEHTTQQKTAINLKGYNRADGIHWYWENKEIAVIDQVTSEIEWCVRKHTLPEEIIQAVRDRKQMASGQWLVEAKRVHASVTQGNVVISINGIPLMTFADDKVLEDGTWVSKIPDDELGRLVCATLWHPYDNIYYYSDAAKKIIYPRGDTSESGEKH